MLTDQESLLLSVRGIAEALERAASAAPDDLAPALRKARVDLLDALSRRAEGDREPPVASERPRGRSLPGGRTAPPAPARTVDAVRRSEERLVLALDAAQQAHWELNLATDTITGSSRLLELFGLADPECLRTRGDWRGLVLEEDRAEVQGAMEEAARCGERFRVEYRIRRPSDGTVRWLLSQGLMHRDPEGGLCRFVGVVSDVTERRQRDEALRESEERLRLALRASNAGVWAVDLVTGAVSWSPENYRLYGMDPGAGPPTLREWGRRVYWEDRERVRRAMREAERRGGEVREAYRVTHPERGLRWLASIGRVERGPAGRALRLTGINLDVTHRKRMEEELVRARDAAESANRAKSDFLARMSHEIRTPMNGVLGMTELCLLEPLPPKIREYLSLARRSARDLLDIINDLLDLARIEAGKTELRLDAFEVRAALGAVLATLGVGARAKGVRLDWSVAPDVPVYARGDRGRLGQVLVNIVGNAIKFTERGEVTVSVGLADEEGAPGTERATGGDRASPNAGSGQRDAVRLSFTVRDTGIGIASERLDAIFDPLTSVEAEHHAQYGGTGLGLSIARQLLGLMGGSIQVESQLGRGSTFFFTAELQVADAPGRNAAPKPEGGWTPGEGRPLRVLLAEDDRASQIFATALLEADGHTVVVAANGLDALENLSRERFDAALLDVQMPEMDGVEVTRRVRAGAVSGCPSELPILAVTAHALEGDRDRFLAAGMDEHLTKPIDPERLRRALRRVAERARARPVPVAAAVREGA